MKDFKNGNRKGTIMGRIAKGYTDEQIDALAKFVAGLK
jgi:sulfide dehydrogenase cytochrome subunit